MRKSDSVLIIYTGGTIGMYKTNEGSLRTFDLDTLSMQIPELNTFDIDINTITIAQPIDSSNMSKEVWIQLAEIIEKSTTTSTVLLFFMAQTPWPIRHQHLALC